MKDNDFDFESLFEEDADCIFIFIAMPGSLLGPLVIGIFEAVALLLIARKLGLEEIIKMVDGLIARLYSKIVCAENINGSIALK